VKPARQARLIYYGWNRPLDLSAGADNLLARDLGSKSRSEMQDTPTITGRRRVWAKMVPSGRFTAVSRRAWFIAEITSLSRIHSGFPVWG
jgi:hypothetical protein